MVKDLVSKLKEQNEYVGKLTLEKLESEHNYVLEKMIESRDNYDDLYGYYFSLVVELYSRYVLEDKNGSFKRMCDYRKSLQKKIEDFTST